MKRFLLGVTILGVAAFASGCPVYPNDGGGSGSAYGEYEVCNARGCFSCPDPTYSSACVPWPCRGDGDCEAGYVCSDYGQGGGRCIPPSVTGPMSGSCSIPSDCANGYTCGQDGTCHAGDCGQAGVGCPGGYVCRLAGGQAQCVSSGQTGDDAGTSNDASPSGEAGSGDDAGTDAIVGDDATGGGDASGGDDGSSTADSPAEATPEAGGPVACNADSDCSDAGAGSRCVDGQCTAQVGLCSDTSQCRVKGSACVDGLCVPHCSTLGPSCPPGWACDWNRGVCNPRNPSPCATSATCQGSVCVEGHCAAPCAATEAGPACPAGQLCINGGCIPDEAAATFACTNDGQSGQVANLCDQQAICLHHDCYTACGPADGGRGSCPDPMSVCKLVTIETGTYAVCANSSTSLGSDCDPAQGKSCASGQVCVDGFCQ